MKRIYSILTPLLIFAILFNGCEDEEYALPKAKTELQNDCIKRSLGPNLVGLDIEFVYAMALGFEAGKIVSAQVEASIAGAPGTYLEHRSFYTNPSGGGDVPVTIGNPSVTNGTKTEVTFTKDTCAAALRYFYKIPEEARGKTVSFTFSAKASTGEAVSYQLGPYDISKMDMKLDLVLSDNNNSYLSISDMAVYNAAGAAANPGKIDLVYLYRAISGITFAHALVSPANSEYLSDVTLPAGVGNSTPFLKIYGLRDQQLARLQYGIYIDDVDFRELDFTHAANYGINMKLDSGAWVETADGKYRAYIFVNKVDNAKKEMMVSIKRYQVK
ncbi:MAG: DUF4466 family protein [Mangrovibacterium sp.]